MECILLLLIVGTGIAAWIGLCRPTGEEQSPVEEKSGQTIFMRIQAWFCQRFRRNSKFGLSLTIGLVVSMLAGWLFGELADEILEQELLTQFDLTFGEGLLSLVSEPVSQLFFAITMAASPFVLIPGVVLVNLWLVNRRRIADAVMMAVAVGGGAVINLTLKVLFGRPRPDFLDMFYEEVGFSFPSGHAMLSVLFYGMLAYLLGRSMGVWGWRVFLGLIAATIALVIGLSRLVLGVHFLSDVLGGWAAGIVWLSACITAREISDR